MIINNLYYCLLGIFPTAVGEDDVDDDLDEARDDDDGDDLPSLGGNFPGRFLPVGERFLSVVVGDMPKRQ